MRIKIKQIRSIWGARSSRWVSKMYSFTSQCGEVAKGGLFWYVYFTLLTSYWCRLWCLLCLWYCTKINYNKKWSL